MFPLPSMAEFNSTGFTTLTSTVDSRLDTLLADSDDEDIDLQFIIVGKKSKNNTELQDAIKEFEDAEVIESDTGMEHINNAGDNTIFVLDNFDGDIYQRLNRESCRILGPPVIIQCAKEGKRLPNCQRPLYCLLMRKLVICFTGFRHKEELARLAELVHHMGGSVRRDVTARVTHLVSRSTAGDKYRVAVSMGTSIMTEDWIFKCWEARQDTSRHATEDQFMANSKMSPFMNLVLAFYGFTKEEEADMEQIAQENGASVTVPGSPHSTHVIVEQQGVRQIDFDVHHRQHVVNSEWFWASVQMDACADESFYKFDYELRGLNTPDSPHGLLDSSTAGGGGASGSKSRKRKRQLRENLAALASEGVETALQSQAPLYKRWSSPSSGSGNATVGNARTSCGTSFLDITPDVSGHLLDRSLSRTPNSPPGPAVKEQPLSARQLVIHELFTTESNYVGILHTILKLFKEEIENKNQPGGSVLDVTDIKMIFGNIPPIYEVHVKLRDQLREILQRPDDDASVGEVILSHADALMKCYPPFVNYFERTKETIQNCDKERPRFHALLMRAKSKPECGRQSLTELLIRPVQRLPSVMLLLKDILKKTEESNPDHMKLKRALEKLEVIMQHINEDKRKTEGHQYLFEIINDIENCPPDLLSSSRNFLGKADGLVVEGAAGLRGDNVTLFIFSDTLAICKRRVKVLSMKSPGKQTAVGSKTPQKAYKHVTVLTLSHIKRVVDVREAPECRQVLALITKSGQEEERMFAFQLIDEQTKQDFLTLLCKTIANAICRTNYETLKACVEGQKLGLDTTDLGARTLGKVATRFGKRVSRAFSFNKTPRKLKRAISSMTQMSPFSRRDSTQSLYTMGSSHGVGAASLARLASVNDLTDETCEEMLLQEHAYSQLVDQLSIGGLTPRPTRHAPPITPRSDFSTLSPICSPQNGEFVTPINSTAAQENMATKGKIYSENVLTQETSARNEEFSTPVNCSPIRVNMTSNKKICSEDALRKDAMSFTKLGSPKATQVVLPIRTNINEPPSYSIEANAEISSTNNHQSNEIAKKAPTLISLMNLTHKTALKNAPPENEVDRKQDGLMELKKAEESNGNVELKHGSSGINNGDKIVSKILQRRNERLNLMVHGGQNFTTIDKINTPTKTTSLDVMTRSKGDQMFSSNKTGSLDAMTQSETNEMTGQSMKIAVNSKHTDENTVSNVTSENHCNRIGQSPNAKANPMNQLYDTNSGSKSQPSFEFRSPAAKKTRTEDGCTLAGISVYVSPYLCRRKLAVNTLKQNSHIAVSKNEEKIHTDRAENHEMDEISITSSIAPSIADSVAPNHKQTTPQDYNSWARKAEHDAKMTSQLYATPMSSRKRPTLKELSTNAKPRL